MIGGFVDASSADELERALHEDGPRVVVLDERGRPVPRGRAAGGVFQAVQPGEPRRVRHGLAGESEHVSSEATEKKPARESTDNVRRLVERAQQGDRDALEELYLIHFDRIYSYLHMSVGNKHDAEDLTTQTFLKMLESINRFRWQSAPFSAWLFRIAHNLAMDHFRARRRWQPEEEVPEPPGSEEPSAELEAMQSIGRQSMMELIEKLSPEQQQVLTLKFVFNFPNADVATILEKTEGAIKSLQHRALASLQKQIAQDEKSSGARSRDRRAAELGQVHALRGADGRARERRGRHGGDSRPAVAAARGGRAGAEDHAGRDPRVRGARHGACAARESAPGRRAARRARRLLRHARAGRRPRDAEARAARRGSRSRRAPARARREAGEVGRREVAQGSGAAREAARASRLRARRWSSTATSFRPSSSR